MQGCVRSKSNVMRCFFWHWLRCTFTPPILQNWTQNELNSFYLNENLSVVFVALAHFLIFQHTFLNFWYAFSMPLSWNRSDTGLVQKLKCNFPHFQQHGSVYWRSGINEILSSLKPEKFLHDQVKFCYVTSFYGCCFKKLDGFVTNHFIL